MNRRRFLNSSLGAGAAVWSFSHVNSAKYAFAAAEAGATPDLVAVKNAEPDVLLDRAMEEFGGMGRFVKKRQSVVIKPNAAWNRKPETGANTNPLLVKRIIEHCLRAGAKKVYVFDNTVAWADKTYDASGMTWAAKEARASLAPGNREKYYQDIDIPNARVLKKTKVHELYLEADVVINVPVLKDHGSTRLTIAMKNLMGVVWDRGWYHKNGLHQSIADFCLSRKPHLNIVDAYRVTMANGPSRGGPKDLSLKKSLIVSPDIVAADAAAAKLFGLKPEDVDYIPMASELKLGSMKLEDLKIKRISL